MRANWIGTSVILLMTVVFFWPMIIRLDSYSVGGDAMFNAWTLARDQNCILRQGCPNYADGNIFFPNKDSMLYSETQLSAGLLTLPLRLLSDNPLFYNNVWTIFSFFLAGWFMYLLAKYFSKGREFLPILAGLVFEFAPFKLAALWHLQNLSIFYLPLAFLLLLKFFDQKHRKYLGWLLLVLVLQFYASWYQMVFVLLAIGGLVLGMLLFKLINWKQAAAVGVVVAVATISTLPLATQFMRFSKSTSATYGIQEQTLYSSSVLDYVKPHESTLVGKIYYTLRPHAQRNSYNLDSFSYHGLVLYVIMLLLLVVTYRQRKKSAERRREFGLIASLVGVGLIGFVVSLGPLLKIAGDYAYGHVAEGIKIAIPAPYMLVHIFLPQLSFIRAIGRASVLVLLVLCCALGYFAYYMHKHNLFAKHRRIVYIAIAALVWVELLPLYQLPMCQKSYCYNLKIPEVYKYVKSHQEVDNIVIVAADNDYPGADIPVERPEWVLWAGYHNRNIFNGTSGYLPPTYMDDYIAFKRMDETAVARMKSLGLRYVIIDKQLSTSEPWLMDHAQQMLSQKVYEDQRFALFKI